MIEFISFLQSFSTPVIDNIFLFISSLTGEVVYIATICFIYWCINKNKGVIAAITLVMSFSLNTLIKNIFMIPRPYTYSKVRQIDTETGYGYSFPSGHAQLSSTFAGLGILNIKRKIIHILGILLAVLTGLSRMYLGVHTPVDILAGYAVGIGIIFLSRMLFAREHIKNRAAVIIFIINAIILMFVKDTDLSHVNILFAGCMIGLLLEERFIKFDVSGSKREKAVRYIFGIVAIVVVKFAAEFAGKEFSYFCIGFTITFLVPFFAMKLKKIKKI